MKLEKSCGAVVYRIHDKVPEFLIIESIHGHFSFPKGHMEKDETEAMTAHREIREETGLEVDLDCSFREVIAYAIDEETEKNVIFFIASVHSGVLCRQEKEIKSIAWMTYEDALKKLSFKNDERILANALHYVQEKSLLS